MKHTLTVMQAFRRFGYVPRMAGGAGDAEAGAPDGGAENGGEANGLYQEALQGVPAELHPYVVDHFKKWDSQVTPKLQEAAQLKERFGPLSEIDGIADVPPEELAELIQFREVLGDRDQLSQWVQQVAQALELDGVGGDLDEDSWARMGQEKGWLEAGEGDGQQGGLDVDQIVQQVRDALKEDLDPVKQFMGSQEQSQAQQQAQQQFVNRLTELEGDTFKEESDEDKAQRRDVIWELAYSHLDDPDPIGKAFERWQQITGQSESRALEPKLDAPGAALNGGRTDSSPEKLSWNNGHSPREAALARMRS